MMTSLYNIYVEPLWKGFIVSKCEVSSQTMGHENMEIPAPNPLQCIAEERILLVGKIIERNLVSLNFIQLQSLPDSVLPTKDEI